MTHDGVPASIAKTSTPIDTTTVTDDTTDMSVIDDQVSEASIIGLGEASHGLRDHYTLKHRLFKRLVTEHGFRLFGMETHLAEALAINEYVVHDEGDAESALEALEFWVWQTEAVKSLVEWMREFNEGRPLDDRIRFYGFDTQSTKAPAAEVTEYLQRVDPDFEEELTDALELARNGVQPIVRDDEEEAPDEVVQERLVTVEDLLTDLNARFEAHRDEYVDATSERAFQMAARQLRLLEQATSLAELDMKYGRGIEYGWQRDEYMAENVAWIREFEDEDCIAVWAANGHLRKGNDHHDDPPDGGPLGYHLDQQFGQEYCAFAPVFGRGSVRMLDTRDDTVAFPAAELRAPATDTLLGALFEQFSEPQYLDPSAANDEELTPWLEDAQTQSFSPLYDPEMETGLESDHRVDFTWEFDGLFFVPEVTAAELLPMVTARPGE